MPRHLSKDDRCFSLRKLSCASVLPKARAPHLLCARSRCHQVRAQPSPSCGSWTSSASRWRECIEMPPTFVDECAKCFGRARRRGADEQRKRRNRPLPPSGFQHRDPARAPPVARSGRRRTTAPSPSPRASPTKVRIHSPRPVESSTRKPPVTPRATSSTSAPSARGPARSSTSGPSKATATPVRSAARERRSKRGSKRARSIARRHKKTARR